MSQNRKYFVHIGEKYGNWTVIDIDEDNHPRECLCRCMCGKEKWLKNINIILGYSKSCGCSVHRDYGISIGDKIGYWTVLSQKGKFFTCKCICGKIRKISAYALVHKKSLSCGCRRLENISKNQKDGLMIGIILMRKIHENNLSPSYSNRKINKNSSTGFTGVSLSKGKFRAYIMVDHKQINLGKYKTIEDAIKARKKGEERYFTEKENKLNKILKYYKTNKEEDKRE